tara:strand:+ start:582 stop:1847 length:1266 start_codon:yes stop_codon:yes gene_type:complete
MAQNIPMGLLQTAQQQFSQGTAAPTQAGTVGVGGGGSSSMETLEGMMAMGGAAQKLAQQRNLENQKGLQRLFAEAGVGSQGLLNTLGIGLGNALGQSMRAGNDPAMDAANAEDARAAWYEKTKASIDLSTPEGLILRSQLESEVGNDESALNFRRLALSVAESNKPAVVADSALVKNINAVNAARAAGNEKLALQIEAGMEKKSGDTTNINMPGNAETKPQGAYRIKQYAKISETAEGAYSVLQNLNELDAIGADTGALEPIKVKFASILEGMGIDASSIANVETAQMMQAVTGRLLNDVLKQSTGPQTDDDANRAMETLAGLGSSPLANRFKIDSLRAVSLRQIQQSEFIDDLMDKDISFSEARKSWRKYTKSTPSLSAVVKNPTTGLPVYYYQFKDHAKTARPGITDKEIEAAWRKKNE